MQVLLYRQVWTNDPALIDWLYRIRPVISILQEKFETLCYRRKEISVPDENIIPFKG